MKRHTFLSATGVALVLAVLAGLGFGTLGSLLAPGATLKLLISGLGFAYLLWLMGGSRRRAGRATAMAAWLVLSIGTWMLAPSVLTAFFLHAALLWLLRSLVRYSGTLPALLDLGISVCAVAAAAWAAEQTGSLFLTAWSFFLVQAAAIAIPERLPRRQADNDREREDETFERARRRADAAFLQLISRANH